MKDGKSWANIDRNESEGGESTLKDEERKSDCASSHPQPAFTDKPYRSNDAYFSES